MEILINDSREQNPHVVLLFGLGMIGSAIRDALVRLQFQISYRIPYDWSDAAQRAQARELIRRTCLGLAPSPRRISIAWSAGRADFFSTEVEVERENTSFEDALQLGAQLKQAPGRIRVDFHYVSSAGGLFEGQRIVNSASVPTPKRPYGWMKQAQENKLRASFDGQAMAIYRPSSVYGSMVKPSRHGLINKLVANAANRQVTVLDANVMALRDYVYSGDIGEFIARRIAFRRGGRTPDEVNYLVSSRCASIFEVVAKIERIMHLKVRYRYDANFGNSANITFSDSVLPAGWRPSILDVGIRQFMLRDVPQVRPILANV